MSVCDITAKSSTTEMGPCTFESSLQIQVANVPEKLNPRIDSSEHSIFGKYNIMFELIIYI